MSKFQDEVTRLALQAAEHGGAWLGCYTTEDGAAVPIYLTTKRPENMTEVVDRLRLPLPPGC